MTAQNWYMVNKMGMATLCTDKEGAEQEAADAQMAWPHMGPHDKHACTLALCKARGCHPKLTIRARVVPCGRTLNAHGV